MGDCYFEHILRELFVSSWTLFRHFKGTGSGSTHRKFVSNLSAKVEFCCENTEKYDFEQREMVDFVWIFCYMSSKYAVLGK